MLAERDRFVDDLDDTLCLSFGILIVRHMPFDDRELVAPESGDDVLAAGDRFHALAHLLQQLVAGDVAIGIVDRLEAVEIQHMQREPLAAAATVADAIGHGLFERIAVGQAGQRIEIGQFLVSRGLTVFVQRIAQLLGYFQRRLAPALGTVTHVLCPGLEGTARGQRRRRIGIGRGLLARPGNLLNLLLAYREQLAFRTDMQV